MTKAQDIINVDHSVNDKATAADPTWLFKVTESDMSLRDCDGYLLLSKRMFVDYLKIYSGSPKDIFCNTRRPILLLEVKIVESVTNSPAAFTLMFDKATTKQQRRQMELLCRNSSFHENEIATSYITSFFFAREKAVDITAMLVDIQEKQNLPWDPLFII